jgi:energy-coupling factor transporter ATP-binding protein EcfA2
MRGELTAALLHGPEVLFLDEPTIGLDVVSKRAVRAFLAALGATGDMTIVLTTHDDGRRARAPARGDRVAARHLRAGARHRGRRGAPLYEIALGSR